MKIFLIANSLRPDYGGPARSVTRLARALGEIGIEVALWAPDGSATTTPLLEPGTPVRRFSGTEVSALDQFGTPDVLHDNGIWMPHHHRIARLGAARRIPRIVSTRGMLEPWAMAHKRSKKRIAWHLYQRRDLQLAARHHATTEAEAGSVRALDMGVQVCVIPNGVDVPELHGSTAGPRSDVKVALFVGRIYPVKGLPMLVEAWARVRPAGWRLHIVGPDEAGHRAVVEKRVAAAGLSAVMSFLGPLEGEAKRAALTAANLFVLPTHSENFGMAIGEALAHGLPVLTTTAAPWPQLEPRACGWRVAPTADALAEALRRATSLEAVTLSAMGRRGRDFVAAEFGWMRIANQFGALYESVRRG